MLSHEQMHSFIICDRSVSVGWLVGESTKRRRFIAALLPTGWQSAGENYSDRVLERGTQITTGSIRTAGESPDGRSSKKAWSKMRARPGIKDGSDQTVRSHAYPLPSSIGSIHRQPRASSGKEEGPLEAADRRSPSPRRPRAGCAARTTDAPP